MKKKNEKKRLGFQRSEKANKEKKKSGYMGDIYNNSSLCLFEIISSNLRKIIISLHNIHYRTIIL